MWNLIVKDLLLQKKGLGFTLLAVTLIFYVFMSSPSFSNYVYVVGTIGIYYIYMTRVAYADYKNNTEVLLLSLPVTRYEMVAAKYLSLLVCAGLALLLTGILGFIASFFIPFRYLNWFDITTALMFVGIMGAVTIPVYARFGIQWGKIVNLLLFLVVGFGAPGFISSFYRVGPEQDLSGLLLSPAWGQYPWLTIIESLALLIVILAVSYLLTLKVYVGKDY